MHLYVDSFWCKTVSMLGFPEGLKLNAPVAASSEQVAVRGMIGDHGDKGLLDNMTVSLFLLESLAVFKTCKEFISGFMRMM